MSIFSRSGSCNSLRCRKQVKISSNTFKCTRKSARTQTSGLCLKAISRASIAHAKRSGPFSLRIGPITILYGKENYRRANCLYIANTVARVCIGATNGVVLFYSIVNADAHAFLCCIGYHFFMMEAIMSLIHTNGWSLPLSRKQRKMGHIFLHLCGMICYFCGTFIALFSFKYLSSTHSILGILTMIGASLTILTGPFALFKGSYSKLFHIFCSLPTVVLASSCLCYALIGSDFRNWIGNIVPYVAIFVTFLYTFYITVMSFLEFVIRFKKIVLKRIFRKWKVRFPNIGFSTGPLFLSQKEVNRSLKIFLSVMNNVIQICIGAINAMFCIYALVHEDLHVFFCCIGYNFFMIEAVLGLNNTYSWSSSLTYCQRKFAHTFLQNCSMLCVILGSFIGIFKTNSLESGHAIYGTIALSLAMATALIGPLILLRISVNIAMFIHKILASSTFIASTLCMIYGLLGNSFQSWTGVTVSIILCCIVVINCVFINVIVFMKFVRHMKIRQKDLIVS